jgi:type I restriction enzyme S subunit
MKTEYIVDSEDHITELAASEWGLVRVPAESVLIVVRGMILAHSLPVALTKATVTVNQDMKALLPTQGVVPEFLMRWFQGVKFGIAGLIEESAHGTRCLRTDLLKRTRIMVPPANEQRAIVEHIRGKVAHIGSAARAVERAVDRLRKYRSVLITAAVTGQLDLREHEKKMEALA